MRIVFNKQCIYESGVIWKKEEQAKITPPFAIQVYGVINRETAKLCIEAVGTELVSGSMLFNSEDMAKEIEALRNLEP